MNFQFKTTEQLMSDALEIESLTIKAANARSKKKRRKALGKLQSLSTALANYYMDLQTHKDLQRILDRD